MTNEPDDRRSLSFAERGWLLVYVALTGVMGYFLGASARFVYEGVGLLFGPSCEL
jgi:hypothetical protein